MKDDTIKLIGHLLPEGAERDAIHVAVLPAVAGMRIDPGSHCRLKDGLAVSDGEDSIGIADPYLVDKIERGERFFVFLYPGSITSLRHVWTHPELDPVVGPIVAADPVSDAKAEIEAIAKSMGSDGGTDPESIEYYGPRRPMTYERLMDAADNWVDTFDAEWGSGDTETEHGSDSWRDRNMDRFWDLYEIVRGKQLPTGVKKNFFGCSC